MPTDKQTAANRANATHSTGPRTPAGKARASQNARKHSFAGSDFSIIKIEERDAVDRLRADIIATYAPTNSQELFAVERIALAQHNLLRISRFEAGLFNFALNRALLNPADEEPFIPLHDDLEGNRENIKVQNRYYCLALGFHGMNRDNSHTWALFLRYQSQAERLYRRAIEEFERLKALRPILQSEDERSEDFNVDELPNEPISGLEPEENPATSAPENEPISSTPAASLGVSRPPALQSKLPRRTSADLHATRCQPHPQIETARRFRQPGKPGQSRVETRRRTQNRTLHAGRLARARNAHY